ncbi:MAG: hypothetical protein ACLP56_12715 [Candidatus Sulfotelmatobacter sp.]
MQSRTQPGSTADGLTLATATVEPVAVNVEGCRRVAGLLRSHSIPAGHEDSSLPGFAPGQVGNFYLLLVAVCHQTSPRGKQPLEGMVGDRLLRGWDYLSAKLEAAARINPEILFPESWARVTAEDVQELFRDETLGDRLSDPLGRALLVRDLGQKMQGHSWKWADELYRLAEGSIATGPHNLLNFLSEFRAYEDPVRKKSFFYLALMQNAGLWTYSDPEKLGAPVDYHEVRGHLRLGTVQVIDPGLRLKLVEGKDVTAAQDIGIRRAVYEALMLISEFSGLRNPNQLHYVFWNVFRSCCTREAPHCGSCPPTCSLPARYVPLALFPSGARRCPFSEVCQSAGQEPKFLEHSLDTDYY